MSIRVSYAIWESNRPLMLALSPEKRRHRKRDDCSEANPPWEFHDRQPTRRLIAERVLSLGGARQRVLLLRDRVPAGIFDLVGLSRVELSVFREFRREVCLGINCVHGAYVDTGRAIDALLGMNY